MLRSWVALCVLATPAVARPVEPEPVPPPLPPTVEPSAPVVVAPAVLPPPPPISNVEALCLEGRPKYQCIGIAVVEAGFRFGITSEGGAASSGILPLQAGLLFNVGPRSAIGATIGLVAYNHPRATDTDDTNTVEGSFGGFVRYRHWLGDWHSVDLSVGAARNGVIGEIAFQANDMIAITAGVHTFPIDDQHAVAANVGLRIGGYLLGALVDVFAR